jgi:hypothetical protein
MSKFSYLYFLNLTHKTGMRLLITTHLHQSNQLANQQHLSGFAAPLPAYATCAEPNWHVISIQNLL